MWAVFAYFVFVLDIKLCQLIPEIDYHYGLEYILVIVYFIALQTSYLIYYGTAYYIDRHE